MDPVFFSQTGVNPEGGLSVGPGVVPRIIFKDRHLPSHVFAYGFSKRKRAILRRFVGDVRLSFVEHAQQALAGSTLLLWGSAPKPEGLPEGVRLVRVEDGFLRSVGLGADLIHPLSWVLDSRGIYYDAGEPSDLEHILLTEEFDAELLERASMLRNRIVKHGLTKYNVGIARWKRPRGVRRVILVPGQVESDASIRFGAPGIHTNMDLLRAVRHANPVAHVVYKPHPDVVAGLRAKGSEEDDALLWCNEVVTDASMGEMLPLVDEVHVLTSLAGFEALLRGKTVVCYGCPFYAGWGLTRDVLQAFPRRNRPLTLDELVAGALILYPTYVSRRTGRLTTPEQALDELLDWRKQIGGSVPLWRKAMRVVLRCVVGAV
jgi:capsular polysaccharide export protein